MRVEPLAVLIEDEVAIARMMGIALDFSDIRMVHASSPEEAYPVLKELEPEVVITDLFRGQEVDLLTRIREAAACPVMVISAMSGNIDELQAIAPGADAYLAKPFNPEELTGRLARLIEQSIRTRHAALLVNQQARELRERVLRERERYLRNLETFNSRNQP